MGVFNQARAVEEQVLSLRWRRGRRVAGVLHLQRAARGMLRRRAEGAGRGRVRINRSDWEPEWTLTPFTENIGRAGCYIGKEAILTLDDFSVHSFEEQEA